MPRVVLGREFAREPRIAATRSCVRAHGRLGLFGQRRRVGITPVDPMVVAARAQNGLLLRADSQRRQVPRASPAPTPPFRPD